MAKKALLVGINYPGTQFELRGCVNDIQLMNSILVNNLGFDDPKLIRMLTDQSATTQNILDRLEWLVEDAQPGDTLFFHYSGHGSQTIDLDYDLNDEPDGYDEIICPIDIDWRDKIIKDDDLKRIFDKVHPSVNLTVVLDCCHSGTGLRDFLPPLEMRDNLFGPTRNKTLPMPIDIENRGFGLELAPKPRTLTSMEDQRGLLISGCASNQTSADTWIQQMGKFHGALTYCMYCILYQHNYNITYAQLVNELNTMLKQSGFTQTPELNGPQALFNKPFMYSN